MRIPLSWCCLAVLQLLQVGLLLQQVAPNGHALVFLNAFHYPSARNKNHGALNYYWQKAAAKTRNMAQPKCPHHASTKTDTPSPSLEEPLLFVELDPRRVLATESMETIQQLVEERKQARWLGDYPLADQLKEQLLALELPEGVVLSLFDVPRSMGGGSVWKLHYRFSNNNNNNNINVTQKTSPEQEQDSKPNVLHLAHAALGLAVSASNQSRGTSQSEKQKQLQIQSLVQQAKLALLQWKTVHDLIMQASVQQGDTSHKPKDDPSSIHPQGHFPYHGDDSGGNHGTSSIHHSTFGWYVVETTLRGRIAADAVYWFALAGVADDNLFDLLAQVCIKELRRFGSKPTCRAKDICQIMDRFAAAGLRPTPSSSSSLTAIQLETVARECLHTKKDEDYSHLWTHDSLLDLHSDRCLLMQWKFSSGLKKQQSFLQPAQKHWKTRPCLDKSPRSIETVDLPTRVVENPQTAIKRGNSSVPWNDRFQDPTRPLVIDIGCGMGISLLGLVSRNHVAIQNSNFRDRGTIGRDSRTSLPNNLIPHHECNFLGIDLSGLGIGYAQGITDRWGLTDRLQWEVDSAETVLEQVLESYPGPVILAMIQFPTPYRINTTINGGNSQLPKSALEGFMVSPNLLELIQQVLSKPCPDRNHAPGKLVLQSNCEDVALWMMDTATRKCGFRALTMEHPVEKALDSVDAPQRTLTWIEMGGARAVGRTWSAVPILPRIGSTETEVACRLNRTPIHRCLLTPLGD
jgi:hypothetical protein